MIYKIEHSGIFRKVTAKIDSAYLEIIKRANGQKFTIPILENKAKKKIEIQFMELNDSCVAVFNVHKAVDLQFIEQLVGICTDILQEIKEAKVKKETLG